MPDEPLSLDDCEEIPQPKRKLKRERPEPVNQPSWVDDESPPRATWRSTIESLRIRFRNFSKPTKIVIIVWSSVFTLLVVVLLIFAVRGKNRPVSDQTLYTIQIAERKVGTKTLVTTQEVTKATEMGLHGEFGSSEETERYTEQVREIKDHSPTKLTRSYQAARKSKNNEAKDAPYAGGVVTIEKSGDLFVISLNGRRLSANEARGMGLTYGSSSQPTSLIPDRPVKIGEVFTFDQDKIRELMRDNPTADADKSSITVMLTKVYSDKKGVQWGVLEYKMEIASTSARGPLEPERATATVTREMPIDGSSVEAKVISKMEWIVVTKEQNGKQVIISVEKTSAETIVPID